MGTRSSLGITIKDTKNKDIVIKKADKGGCIVVQDRSSYVSEGRAHLADTSTYKPLDSDLTASIAKGIGEVVESIKEAGYIDTHTHAYLHPTDKVRKRNACTFLRSCTKPPVGLDLSSVAAAAPLSAFHHSLTT